VQEPPLLKPQNKHILLQRLVLGQNPPFLQIVSADSVFADSEIIFADPEINERS